MKFMANIYGNLGYYYHSKGMMNLAEQNYVKMMRNGKPHARLEGTYGVLLLKRGQFEQALERLNGALDNKECKGELRHLIRMNRAVAHFRMGLVDEAIAELEEVHAEFKSLRVYQTLGYIYTAARRYDKAEPYNLEAIDYDPQDPVVLDNAGQMYLQMEQYNKAKEYCERAYAKKHISDVCYHQGLIAEWEGKPQKALEYYREALTKNIDALNDVKTQDLKDRIAALREKLGIAEPEPDEDEDDI